MKQKKGMLGFAFLPIAIVLTFVILTAVFIFVSTFVSSAGEERKVQQMLLDATVTTRIIAQYEISDNRYVYDLITERIGVEDFEDVSDQQLNNLMEDLADALEKFNVNQPVDWIIILNEEVYAITFTSPLARNRDEQRIITRLDRSGYAAFPPGILLPNPRGESIELLIGQRDLLDEILEDGDILTLSNSGVL